jgi:hypothetical protein
VLGLAGPQQLVDGGVAFPGARREAAFGGSGASGRARTRLFLLPLAGLRRAAFAGGRLVQATAVAAHGLAGVFGQVVPQMPSVGHLDGIRGAVAGAL